MAAPWLILLLLVLPPTVQARTADFNRGWRFYEGDVPDAKELTFDDAHWQSVRTPHDWAIAGPFDPNEHGYAGKLPWRSVGWYRKWMTVDERDLGSKVYLDFDGVMSSPQVYVNGHLAGAWDYGYTSFRVDATPYVRFGRANVIAVRVDNRRHGTRWYPGAGIYRDVSLTISPPVHLAHHGTAVVTPEVTTDSATVVVTNEVDHFLELDQPVNLKVTLFGPSGDEVTRKSIPAISSANGRVAMEHHLAIPRPSLWDIDRPNLYRCITELEVQDQVVERRETTFGIRTFRFTANDGFHLNGRRVPLQGVNLHHDLGPLGAAYNDRAMEHRLAQLKDMGVNAIRTSHNPPAAAMLDQCDRMGLLVWDELFDKWDETADRIDGEPGFEQHIARHTASFVRRDRNHPSIIAWSIGNEIPNQPEAAEGKSRERIRFVRNEFLRHDATRPVGMACHIPRTADRDILNDLDVVGWNYNERYQNFRRQYPMVPIIYSETASALSSRGHYAWPLATDKCDYGMSGQLTAYEMLAAPWADIAEVEFDRLERDEYLAGEFVWTGFDYLGEPTPFEQDSRSSYFGIIDLVGFPKDRYYLYRSIWRPDEPTLHIAPHWTWPEREGQVVPVIIYTNGDSAELFLNGQSLGKRVKGQVPTPPTNLVVANQIEASSSKNTDWRNTFASRTLTAAEWEPAADDEEPWLSIDLQAVEQVRSILLEFPRESKHYTYTIEVMGEAGKWVAIAERQATSEPQWGGVNQRIHQVDLRAGRLRIRFGECAPGVQPAVQHLGVYREPVESEYYACTYRYRLRWNDVVFHPGELKAIAYRDGEQIAEHTVRTAGAPARLRLTPNRQELLPDGIDVCHLTIEAVDQHGTACPFADNEVELQIEGPAELAGVGNGDPTSLTSFTASRVRLFGGKAMVIVRTQEGFGGAISVAASAAELESASTILNASRPQP